VDPAVIRGAEPPSDAALERFVAVVLRCAGHDFRHYARASLQRRVVRLLGRLGLDDLDAVTERLASGDHEILPAVLEALTVQVTDLFRDPPFFAALRADVLPVLATWSSIKVWVAGCSTGEEAWSLAILLDEAGLLDRSLVYATDISEASLKVAAEAVYPAERLARWEQAHRESGGTRPLTDWFTSAYGRLIAPRRLRDRVVVADHSLATDGVFSEVHLVTCRNVLIYFDTALQERALGLFRDALVLGGFLGLGSRESLRGSLVADAFEPVVAPWRIFRRLR
jgi:chemotaxis protein methyltransferase CheR